MTCVYHPVQGNVLADHSLVRFKNEWHLFYVTGEIRYADECAPRRRGKEAVMAA